MLASMEPEVPSIPAADTSGTLADAGPVTDETGGGPPPADGDTATGAEEPADDYYVPI